MQVSQSELDLRLREMLERLIRLRQAFERPYGRFAGPEDLVLSQGTFYTRDLTFERRLPRLQAQECFVNAAKIAYVREDRFVYCEGFAISVRSPYPIHHAWNVDTQDGRILDATWTVENEPYSYVGLTMNRKWADARRLSTRFYALLDPPGVRQLCEEGFPDEARPTHST